MCNKQKATHLNKLYRTLMHMSYYKLENDFRALLDLDRLVYGWVMGVRGEMDGRVHVGGWVCGCV